MSQPFTSDFETAQTLRRQATDLSFALSKLYREQAAITVAAVPYKARWEREFAQLVRIGRIIEKVYRRCDRRQAIVHKFFI